MALAFVLTPILVILIVAFLPPIEKNIERKMLDEFEARRCPRCAELVKMEATVCKHCGGKLPKYEPKYDRLTGARIA